MTESLQTAERTRDALRGKLDAARTDLARIDEQRRAIAFEAHSQGGDAKVRLQKMGRDRLAILDSIETLEVALLEASRQVDAGEREVALAEQIAKAERALEIGAGLMERAKKLDEALALVVEESNAFQSDLRELNHRLGCTHPNEFQLAALGTRAFKAAVMFSPLQVEHLAPNERHSFTELAADWSLIIDRWASPWLAKKDEAA